MSEIDWSVVSAATVLYTVAQGCAAVVAFMAFLSSRANRKVVKANTEKIVKATEVSEVIAEKVNGHQTALVAQLVMTIQLNEKLQQTVSHLEEDIVRLRRIMKDEGIDSGF